MVLQNVRHSNALGISWFWDKEDLMLHQNDQNISLRMQTFSEKCLKLR